MCGSLERKAPAAAMPETALQLSRSATQSRDGGSLTVCAGYLCGRLQLDQQIHLAESSIDLSSNCQAIGAQVGRFCGAKCFVLVLN